MTKATETPNAIEPKDASPCFQVKRLVSEPFATKEDVAHYFSGDTIQCLICGKWFCSLATHLVRVHETSVDEYKIMFGLPHSRGLVSDKTAKRQAEALQKRIDEGDKSIIVDPTTLDKKSPREKHKPVHYSKKARAPRMVELNHKRREDNLKRLDQVDWGNILSVMKNMRKGAWSLSKMDDMPSYYEFQEKIRTDAEFAKKYTTLMSGIKRVEKECPVCKKTFDVKLSHRKIRRTCSYECMAKDFKMRGISVGANRWKKARTDVKLPDSNQAD